MYTQLVYSFQHRSNKVKY